jgi:uncharacterized repeat protein (TIGR03806 family)
MRLRPWFLAPLLALATADTGQAQATVPLQRAANTTLQMPPAPPSFGYTSGNAWGTLTFTNPVCIASPPGETNRLFILEKRGRMTVITNLAAPTRTVFMDITSRVTSSENISDEQGLLGLAFHPGYATNRFFYLDYTGNATTTAGTGRHDILARFETSAANADQGLPGSEQRLIVQLDEGSNHNAGDLHFGPDGYLYVSLGDEGGAEGQYNNTQRINKDFFSGILRIDVDKRPGSLPPNPHPAATSNYAVPPDNPFVGADQFNGLAVNSNNVRTEFWAVGLRNPWRMSFDPVSGLLYCGDVGQGTREEIDLIVKGANYGWNYWEGFLRRTNSALIPAGFVHAQPLIDYSHSVGISVTGGRVSRGQRLSQLYGAYLYADYGSGRVWALRHTGTNVTQNTVILTDSGISAFGIDPRNSDVLYADLASATNATIDRINYSSSSSGAPLPATLADTGAFTNLDTLTPHAGIVPYNLNVPFWSDHAIKTRWVSLPNTNSTINFSPAGNWSFPTGTVWIKHFELELTNGVASSRKRLETRFIVRNSTGVYGVTYRWGDSLTNATLVAEEGLDEPFVIDQGGGILRTQVWHYPSRTECLLCHTPAGGLALGFNTAQLNRDYDYVGVTTNQIAALSLAGYFSTNVTGIHTLPALAHPTNSAASLEYRARSYLAANCSQCHQPNGTVQGLWDARITTPIALAGLINGALIDDDGSPSIRVIAPGSPANSMLLTRISTLGTGRMPPLDSHVLDQQAIDLIGAWITNDLPNYQSFADWQANHFGSTNDPNALALADPDNDGANNLLEYLTGTDPRTNAGVWKISVQLTSERVQVLFPQIANRGFEVQATTDLFGADPWQALDVPGNQPFFSVTNRIWAIEDAISGAQSKFYRVRVFE